MQTIIGQKLLPYLLVVLVSIVAACTSQQTSHTNQQIPTAHRWSPQELDLLRSLWIENLGLVSDSSNAVDGNPLAISLGKKFFFEKRFSANGKISCAHCHKPELYFTDGKTTARGIGLTARNTPTIVGTSHSSWFFHDGRADSLWSQALGPPESAIEHGGNRSQFAQIIFQDSGLRADYESLFGPMPDISDHKQFPASAGPVADKEASTAWKAMSETNRKIITGIFVNMGKAIAAYEGTINPGPSRFDAYVKAAIAKNTDKMKATLSESEVAGLRLFISKANCILCHSGPQFTDFGFHNIAVPPPEGIEQEWGRYQGASQVLESEFNCRGQFNDQKNGKCQELDFILTDKHTTAGAFKTPSLRNTSKTAPYMHAGQYATLSEVLEHYNNPPEPKLGHRELLTIELSKTELAQLEDFLLALDDI